MLKKIGTITNKKAVSPESQIQPFVGWVETMPGCVGFHTSTQPTHFGSI
jgi:hypothetical protein